MQFSTCARRELSFFVLTLHTQALLKSCTREATTSYKTATARALLLMHQDKLSGNQCALNRITSGKSLPSLWSMHATTQLPQKVLIADTRKARPSAHCGCGRLRQKGLHLAAAAFAARHRLLAILRLLNPEICVFPAIQLVDCVDVLAHSVLVPMGAAPMAAPRNTAVPDFKRKK